MRALFLIVCLVAVTGCASNGKRTVSSNAPNPKWEWLFPTTCPGLRPEDPQFCRGEGWDQIPNQEFEAQIRRARGEQW